MKLTENATLEQKDLERFDEDNKDLLIERSAHHFGVEKPYRIYKIEGLKVRIYVARV